ncbi:hypothetical protein DS901_12425 [Loktanella sp. D2R18]|nr:hypothetical protein [Yoonia sp. 1_MG-2023]MDO6592115.1 hypothetical protein [Yoonia sp. 1_MG-2023]RBW42727.1 hypothetical protein DS901_12425 [Loktanella sp. D2R18]
MKLIFATAALTLCTTGAMAQGFTGGSVDLSYSGFANDDDREFDMAKFDAAGQFAITNEISFAGNLTVRNSDALGEAITGLFVHGIYNINPDVSLGLFAGQETTGFYDITTYGGEVAYVSGPVEGQAFIGSSDITGDTITIFGVAGSYGFGNGFSAIGSFERADANDTDVFANVLEIGAEYALENGAAFYASVGNAQFGFMGLTEDENFFRIGATFNFGPDGGTTFDRRSFTDAYPILGL